MPGSQFTLDYDTPASYEFSDDIVYEGNNMHLHLTVTGVPEPATICIFSLGALSLIRRKK